MNSRRNNSVQVTLHNAEPITPNLQASRGSTQPDSHLLQQLTELQASRGSTQTDSHLLQRSATLAGTCKLVDFLFEESINVLGAHFTSCILPTVDVYCACFSETNNPTLFTSTISIHLHNSFQSANSYFLCIYIH